MVSGDHGYSSEILNIAILLNCSLFVGLSFRFLKQPPIVGYILTGLILGQSGLGLVTYRSDGIGLLAELGVVMLLFIIGMELSVKAFTMVLGKSLITASGQITFSMLISSALAWIFGWNYQIVLLMGFILAISSTAVVFAMLEEINSLRTHLGQKVIGVMIAQDLAVVPMIIIVGALGGENSFSSIAITFFKLLVAIAVLLILIKVFASRGKIVFPFTDMLKAQTGLLTLAMVAFCFASAAITSVLGLSSAYGAFLSGLCIAVSTLRSDAIRVAHPVQSILMMLFFVSIGLLIDMEFVKHNFLRISALTFGGLIVKTIFNVFLFRIQGSPYEKAIPAGVIMAQIGEFSFVLAGIGLSVGIFSETAHQLVVSVIALSLLVSPLWMSFIRRITERTDGAVLTFPDLLSQVYGYNYKGSILAPITFVVKPIMSYFRSKKGGKDR